MSTYVRCLILLDFSGFTIYRAQNTLRTVDIFAKDLHESLAARNLTEIVDIIFVSDHGMTETVNGRSIDMVYLDDILGEEYNNIEHEDGQHHILSIREKINLILIIYVRLAFRRPAIPANYQHYA